MESLARIMTLTSVQWTAVSLMFKQLPRLLVGLKKDLRNNPKTIKELQKSGHRPVDWEEVGNLRHLALPIWHI